MTLVAVKAACAGLVAVAGVRVDGRDDAVFGDPPGDPEDPVIALIEVLADQRRQQHRRLTDPIGQRPAVERAQQRAGIPGQRVDELLAGRAVVVVADRLARACVVVIAAQQATQLVGQILGAGTEQAADPRPHQRHRVHRRDRVIQARGIQHAAPADQPGLLGGLQDNLEDPVRALRSRQPGTHVDQHRVNEPRVVEVQAAGRVLPARIEREAVDRLTIAAALDALQRHHDRHDHRRYTVPPTVGEQVSEHLIREQNIALTVQQPINRVRRHPALAEVSRRGEQARLHRRQPQTHTLKHRLRVGRSRPATG